jgi:hypothetical protein
LPELAGLLSLPLSLLLPKLAPSALGTWPHWSKLALLLTILAGLRALAVLVRLLLRKLAALAVLALEIAGGLPLIARLALRRVLLLRICVAGLGLVLLLGRA